MGNLNICVSLPHYAQERAGNRWFAYKESASAGWISKGGKKWYSIWLTWQLLIVLYSCSLHSLHLNKSVPSNYVVLHGRTHLGEEQKEKKKRQQRRLPLGHHQLFSDPAGPSLVKSGSCHFMKLMKQKLLVFASNVSLFFCFQIKSLLRLWHHNTHKLALLNYLYGKKTTTLWTN